MTRLALLALMLLGCGRGELQGPPAVVDEPEAPAPAPAQAAPTCVVTNDLSNSRWECETVSALEITSVRVTNADGTSPWTRGQPLVKAVMRNTTGQFLNYPSVQIDVSSPSLAPLTTRDALYGLSGCDEAELGMAFGGTVPSFSPVTFTAKPAHINGDDCPLSFPAVSVTVTAP